MVIDVMMKWWWSDDDEVVMKWWWWSDDMIMMMWSWTTVMVYDGRWWFLYKCGGIFIGHNLGAREPAGYYYCAISSTRTDFDVDMAIWRVRNWRLVFAWLLRALIKYPQVTWSLDPNTAANTTQAQALLLLLDPPCLPHSQKKQNFSLINQF